MLRNVFSKTIRDRRRSLLWWYFGIFAYVLFQDAFWPLIDRQRDQLEAVVESFPPEMLALFGVDGAGSLFSPEGYIASRSFGWVVPVVFSILAVSMGAKAIAGEEEARTIDLLASNPITRASLLWQKAGAMVVVMLGLGLALFASNALGGAIWGLGIPLDRYAAATTHAVLLGLVFGSVALAAGGLGARRPLISGMVSALAVGSFLLNSLGGMSEALDRARRLSPFYYYDAHRPLVNGFDWSAAVVLVALIVSGLVIAQFGFDRRDLGV